MEYGWEFFLTIAASSAGSAVLLGVAAFFGRTQLSHWLNKDLEKLKNQYARELETHKVMLIVDAERTKAAQEIRKASALMILGKKFQAFADLTAAVSGISAVFIGATTSPHRLQHDFDDVMKTFSALRKANDAAAPFLSNAEKLPIAHLLNACTDLFQHADPDNPAFTGEVADQHYERLIEHEAAVERVLFSRLSEMSEI